MFKPFLLLLFVLGATATPAFTQVCDDLLTGGIETSLNGGWKKISVDSSGVASVQYCHPKFYIGSGHVLTIRNTSFGDINFDDLQSKKTLSNGLKCRKAFGKNVAGASFTGLFLYDGNGTMTGCYFLQGRDEATEITIPK